MVSFSCDGLKHDLALRYEVLVQNAPFGFILVDLSGQIVEVNEKAIDIIGHGSTDIAKEINVFSFEPMEKSGFSQLVRDAIGSGKRLVKIFSISFDNITTTTVKCTVKAILDESGNVCFIVVLLEDISQLEQLKNKYWKIARTLASVVDGIHSHAIWAKDENGVFQMVNQEYADMFGKTPMDIVGKTDYDLFPEEQCQKYRKDDLEVLTSCGQFETEELVHDPRYEEPRRWRTIKSAVCDEDGKGAVVVGLGEDITDEYNRRQTAKKAIEELELFVKRTKSHV